LIIGEVPKIREEPPKIRGRLSLTLGELTKISEEPSLTLRELAPIIAKAPLIIAKARVP